MPFDLVFLVLVVRWFLVTVLDDLPVHLLVDLAEIRRVAVRDQIGGSQGSRGLKSRRRKVARKVSNSSALANCGRRLTGPEAVVKGEWRGDVPVAGVSGVWHCGRMHLCADCAGKVREKRATKVTAAAKDWLTIGGHLAFVTMTVGRRKGEPMSVATAALTKVAQRFTRLLREAGWYEQAGVIGSVESWEWTVDQALDGSGHPHLMRLYMFQNGRSLGDWHYNIAPLWLKAAKDCGRHASWDFGIKVQHPELDDDGTIDVLSDYMVKGGSPWGVGRELTRSDRKSAKSSDGGYAPFEVLDVIYETGEGAHAWREYEKASAGKATARFSRGLQATISACVASGRRLDGTPLAPLVDDDDAATAADIAAQIAEEEESVTDDVLEGKVYLRLQPITHQWAFDQDLTHPMLCLVEEAMLLERNEGIVIDVPDAVAELFARHGASRDVMFGIIRPDDEDPATPLTPDPRPGS